MRVRKTKRQKANANTNKQREIEKLIEELATADEEIQALKEIHDVANKRQRLKGLMDKYVPLDKNKERFVLIPDYMGARVFYRRGRVNVDVEKLRSLVPASVFDKVSKQSNKQTVLEIATPDEFEERRKRFKRNYDAKENE